MISGLPVEVGRAYVQLRAEGARDHRAHQHPSKKKREGWYTVAMSSSWCLCGKQHFRVLLIFFLEKHPHKCIKRHFSAMIKNSLRGRRLFEDIIDHSDRRDCRDNSELERHFRGPKSSLQYTAGSFASLSHTTASRCHRFAIHNRSAVKRHTVGVKIPCKCCGFAQKITRSLVFHLSWGNLIFSM